jgi:Tfp pilus assembly protein PilO
MTKTRQWSLLTVGIIAVVFLAGWFLAISPQKSHAASLRKQQASQEQANLKLQTTLATLSAQSKDVVANQARLAVIAKELPATPDIATYVRPLTAVAAASNVDLVSIAPGTPAALGPLKAPTPAAPSAAAGATGNTAPLAATASPTAVPGPVNTGPVNTGPVNTGGGAGNAAAAAAGLQSISVAVVVNGDYFAVEQFLTKLQAMQRATIVSSVSLVPAAPLLAPGAIAPSPNNAWKTIGASISLTIFEGAAPPTIVTPAAPLAAPGAAANPSAATN